jgi:hypothetical protein
LNITEMKRGGKITINSPRKRDGAINIVAAVLSLAIIIIVALSVTSTTAAFAAATATTTTKNNQNVPPSYNSPQSKGMNQGGALTHQPVKEPVAQQGSVLKVSESSFVQGVKITEANTTKSPDIVSIKLAQVVQGNTTTNNKSSTKVGGRHTPDITLVALADQTQGNGKVADSTIVKGGWSDSKIIDMKIAGIDFTKGTPMIRVLAVPLTSSSKQVVG